MDPRLAFERLAATARRDAASAAGDTTFYATPRFEDAGQAAVMLSFPERFVRMPVIEGTGALDQGATWDPLNLPTWSTGVLRWDIDEKGFYVGVLLACVARNTGGPSTFLLHVRGTALRNT